MSTVIHPNENEGRDGGLPAVTGSADHLALIAELSMENRRYKKALVRIQKWFDEFPATGRAWPDGAPMSYSAAFGSNGERDYMRQVAENALSGQNVQVEGPPGGHSANSNDSLTT